MGLKNAFGRWFGKNNSDEEKLGNDYEMKNEEFDEPAETDENGDIAIDGEKSDSNHAELPQEVAVNGDLSENYGVDEIADETYNESENFDDALLSGEAVAQTIDDTATAIEDAEVEIENGTSGDKHETVDDAIVEKPSAKKGFFARLISGLEKTRKSFNDKIDSVLKMFTKIDEDLFEELEEALILADVGVDTSTYIVGCLREAVKEKHIKEPTEVKAEIEKIISDILSRNDTSMKLDTTPSVIMVIGVNGVGKTTSDRKSVV